MMFKKGLQLVVVDNKIIFDGKMDEVQAFDEVLTDAVLLKNSSNDKIE